MHPLRTILIALLIASLTGCAGERAPDPENRIVILLDGSGSYFDRQQEAVERVTEVLGELSETELHRWESGQDHITLISLDALPDVLWEGTLRDLQAMDPDAWAARFAARSDYAGCTDVAAAFRLAGRQLDGDSRYVHKYLFVFSDLITEPPTTSMTACAPRRSLPANEEDFPWAELNDVSVSVFWLPPDQKLAWQRATAERGLTGFALYTTSESGNVEIAPPPRPTVERTDEERRATREQLADTGRSLLTTAVIGGLVAIVGLIALAFVLSRRRAPRSVPPLQIQRPNGAPRRPPVQTPRRPR